jgi:hypothetical protein
MQLDHTHARLLNRARVHVRVDIRFHHADGEAVPQAGDGAAQRGGFARAG